MLLMLLMLLLLGYVRFTGQTPACKSKLVGAPPELTCNAWRPGAFKVER